MHEHSLPLADMVLLRSPTYLCHQVIFGILGGLIAGLILGCTRLFCTRNKRLVSSMGRHPMGWCVHGAQGRHELLGELAGRLYCSLQDRGTCRVLTSPCLTYPTLQVGIYGSALLLMFFLEYYNLLSGAAGVRAEHK